MCFSSAPMAACAPTARSRSSPGSTESTCSSWLSLITADAPIVRGRKLVVQLVETVRSGVPGFVEKLDAVEVGRRSGMPIAPVMIYGEDVSPEVSEEGIAYLDRTTGEEERRAALAAIAGATAMG